MRLQHSPTRNIAASRRYAYFSLSSGGVEGSSNADAASFEKLWKFLIARMICAVPARSSASTASGVAFVDAASSMARPRFWYIWARRICAWRRRIFTVSIVRYFSIQAISPLGSPSLPRHSETFWCEIA